MGNVLTNINLKYLIIIVVLVSALMIIGSFIFSSVKTGKPTSSPIPSPLETKQNQPAVQQIPSLATPPPPLAAGSPATDTFTARIKEVKNDKIIIETEDSKHQVIEIPLNKNVAFTAWIYKDGKNNPPVRESVPLSGLKIGQRLDIFKTEVNNNPPVYEITILNY